jgi:hypothetical protein
MTPHHHDQRATEIDRQQWHYDRSYKTPHHQRMPLPLPNSVKQAQGMVAQMFDLLPVERKSACVKQIHTQLDERQEQHQVERSRHV